MDGSEIFISVDTNIYKVHQVYFGNSNEYIYLLTPVNSTVNISNNVENLIGYRNGKTSTAVIKVK